MVFLVFGPFLDFLMSFRRFAFFQRIGGLGRGDIISALLLTSVAYLVFFWKCSLLAYGMGIPLGFWRLAGMLAVTNLVCLLPVSVFGFGTREASLVYLFGRAGLPAETAVAYSLAFFVAETAAAGALGGVALWLHPLPVKFNGLQEEDDS